MAIGERCETSQDPISSGVQPTKLNDKNSSVLQCSRACCSPAAATPRLLSLSSDGISEYFSSMQKCPFLNPSSARSCTMSPVKTKSLSKKSSLATSLQTPKKTPLSRLVHCDAELDIDKQKDYNSRRRKQVYKLSCFLFAILISTILPVPVAGGKDEESYNGERLVCMEGVSPPPPGVTLPRGDIFLEVGDTLEVFCKLNLTNPSAKGYNASNIDFVFTKVRIPEDKIEVKVLNESTAVVRVKNMNESNPFLRCVLKKPEGGQISVCQNQIDVGYPPFPVEDFRCVSMKWKSLNCTWKLPPNPVPTKYTLTKLWVSRYPTSDIHCPNSTTTPTSCTWDGRTEPHYRANIDPINLRLNGTNPLKPSGTIWNYSFSLGTIVVPDKPTLSITKVSSTNYTLNWTFLDYEYFKPGLEHQLEICSEFPGPCNVTNYITELDERKKRMDGSLIVNVSLFYAYANYTIKVRIRSPIANKTEEFWSEPEIKSVLTDGRAPDAPPETDLGSFETIIKNVQVRDVYIYWKSIPREYWNGPDFKYEITIFENKSEIKIKPSEPISESFAKFSNLKATSSYHFYIKSVNSFGMSENVSEVFVPSHFKMPKQPKSVSKVDFTNGSFEISWKRPEDFQGILSYTIFRCVSTRPRPYQCDGRLEWDRVEATKTETSHKFYNLLPQHADRIYQFAVSANTNKYASGIIWATCTLIHGKVPGKLRSVRFEDPGEDQILIKWDLECSYQSGDIEGFEITYCQLERYPSAGCKDDERSVAVEGANATSYRLMKLKAYSYYKVFVSIITAVGLSERSDPIFARTSEGVPQPPFLTGASEVSNTSATLEIGTPLESNGVLREYKIYYRSEWEDREHELRIPLQESNQSESDESFVQMATLKNLTSNSNYTAYVIGCTSKCSVRSQPYYFITDIGHTDLTSFPRISWSGGYMDLEWDSPTRRGGPITYFEITLKKNGDDVNDPEDYPTIEYLDSAKIFTKEIPQSCEPSTNFTAQVRAVTELDDGQYLYGAWSPPANYSCGGGTGWLIWVILVFVVIIGAVLFGYSSVRCYHYMQRMKEGLTIKLPPGLNSELNGFAMKPPPRSRSSEQGFGKDTYAYPLEENSTQLDESKDFLSTSDLNQGEAEESLIEKPFCPSPTNPLLGGMDFSGGGDMSNIEDLELHEIQLTEFSSIHQDEENPLATSSPKAGKVTYKKMGIMTNGTVLSTSREPIPGPSSRSTPSTTSLTNHQDQDLSGSSSGTSPSSIRQVKPAATSGGMVVIANHRTLPTLSTISTTPRHEPPTSLPNGIHKGIPEVLSSPIPSSPTSPNHSSGSSTTPTNNGGASPPPAHPAPPPPSVSSYVKWTTLMPDMKTGDGPLENGNRQSPYCQVGILLDS